MNDNALWVALVATDESEPPTLILLVTRHRERARQFVQEYINARWGDGDIKHLQQGEEDSYTHCRFRGGGFVNGVVERVVVEDDTRFETYTEQAQIEYQRQQKAVTT